MLDSSVAIIYPNQLTGYLMDVSVPSSSGWKNVGSRSSESRGFCKVLAYCFALRIFCSLDTSIPAFS
jgi:hypothetical protein